MLALVVDDDVVFRGLASGILARIGFTVLVAKNTQEAAELGSTGPPLALALID